MFKYNLKRYNCPLGLIDNLMLLIDMYYKIEMKNQNSLVTEENRYFIEVQKKLVDLFPLAFYVIVKFSKLSII